MKRRTPHGVRGLKLDRVPAELVHTGRTPHGVRGLKRRVLRDPDAAVQSHPSRGAWIETMPKPPSNNSTGGRTPHGVRGLKHYEAVRVRRGR